MLRAAIDRARELSGEATDDGTAPPSSRSSSSSAARKLEGIWRAFDARSSRSRRVWHWPTRRSSRSRSPRSSARWTRRSAASPRSSASTRSCSRCRSGRPRACGRPVGFALFALASLGCGVAGSLEVLLVFRALQAVGGAAALIAAFAVLDAGTSRSGRRLWLGAGLIGTAAGPAIGGALTEAFDWRAIFIVQAPLAAAAALACVRREPRVATAAAAAAPAPDGPRGRLVVARRGPGARGPRPGGRPAPPAGAPRARRAAPACASARAAAARPAAPARDTPATGRPPRRRRPARPAPHPPPRPPPAEPLRPCGSRRSPSPPPRSPPCCSCSCSSSWPGSRCRRSRPRSG